MAAEKRKQSYTGNGVTVTFDPNVCIHSAVCVKSLPEVFDVSKKRWVQPEHAAAETVVETVRKCPSGALQVSREAPSDRDG